MPKDADHADHADHAGHAGQVISAIQEIREVYRLAGEEIAARASLTCRLSGLCCRFREAGHRLYLTAPEYEEMVHHGGTPAQRPDRPDGACPWLEDGLCVNREGRALACRTYFCSDEEESGQVTERGHRRIRDIHERYGLPYEYRSLEEHRNLDPRISSEEV
ncbi:MAG: YkgJ family cysteine cluster protein [Planctomycetota bacterium]